MEFRVLAVGDVVGAPGLRFLQQKLRGIKRRARNRVNNRLLAMKSDGSNPDVQQTASTASTTSMAASSPPVRT